MSPAAGRGQTWRHRPLEGVRVLEISHSVAAAHAGKMFREFGAEVFILDREARPCGECDLPIDLARQLDAGKRHAAGDETQGDYDIVVTDADCCLRALSSRVPDQAASGRTGQIRARIRHASTSDQHAGGVSPFGATALAGVATAIGHRGKEPLGLPAGVAETVVGTNVVAAVLGAWLQRDRISGPIDVEVSTSDCLEFFVGMNSKMYEGYPRSWTRSGRRASGSAGPYPAAIFQCKDGYVGLIGRSKADWRGLVRAMGDPEWAQAAAMQDPWFISEHRADDVDPHLQAWASTLTEAEIVELSLAHGFVVAPIRTVSEVMREPQLIGRGFWRDAPNGSRTSGMPFVVTEPRVATETKPVRVWPPQSGRRSLNADPARLLAGIRVLDLSWVWAGPMVTMVLADLGAEVIKIEHPNRPDGSRTRGRPVKDGQPVPGPELEVTPYFHQVGHGKFSFRADLKDPHALEQVRGLVRDCDIVVENMRPGVMSRLGLGYDELASINPEIVMLSMTLAGQAGPLSQLKGYAPVMGGLSGLEGLIGYGPDDVTGMYTFSFCDPNGATYGLAAVLAALASRGVTGRGSWIDLSQLEAAVMCLPLQVARADDATFAGPQANGDPRYRLQAAVQCDGADAWVAVTVVSDVELQEVATFVGTEAAAEPVRSALQRWAAVRSRDAVIEALESRGALAEPILGWDDVVARRVANGRQQTLAIHHPFGGLERVHVPPWRYQESVPGVARRAPLLGEHTEQVIESFDLGTPADLASANSPNRNDTDLEGARIR